MASSLFTKILLILVLTFLVFSPAIKHEFVNWDDEYQIAQNAQIRSLELSNIITIFTTCTQRTYIPLTNLFFATEYHFFGKKPFIYHLNNIFLHLVVVFLVFLLGRRLGLGENAALIASFVFALHPMHVESVAWATERKDVLYSTFYLLSILSYLSFQKSKSLKAYFCSLLMGILSILSKPMALSLPLILLVFDIFKNKRLTRNDFLNKIPYFLMVGAITWITYSQHARVPGQFGFENLLTWVWTYSFYLKKFFYPFIFVPHYVMPKPIALDQFEYFLSVVIFAGSIFLLVFSKSPWVKFALGFFFFSVFFLMRFDEARDLNVVADRFMYLPSLGFCFLLGHFFEQLISDDAQQKWKFATKLLLLVVCVYCVVKTSLQVVIWRDAITMWTYNIKHVPNSFVAFNNRGQMYERELKMDLAFADYSKALSINPYYDRGYVNLGNVYLYKNMYKEAMINYMHAISLNQNYEKAFTSRGRVFANAGDYEAALRDFDQALVVKPNYSAAYNNRALTYANMGKKEEALADFNKAIEYEDDYFEAYSNRGIFYIKQGELDKALPDLQKAIELKPDFADAYSNLSLYYLRMRNYPEALKNCLKATQLDPRHAIGFYNCSVCYRRIEKFDEAMAQAHKAKEAGYAITDQYLQQLKNHEQ